MVTVWRRRVRQGGECYIWGNDLPSGRPDTAAVSGVFRLCDTGAWWRFGTDYGFHIDRAAPVGVHTVSIGGQSVCEIEVLPAADSRTEDVVVYPPGLLTLTEPIVMRPGQRLVGWGCVMRRAPQPGVWGETMIVPADGATVEGFTFCPTQQVFGSPDRNAVNFTVDNCTFFDGGFGYWANPEGLLVTDCTFDRTACDFVMGGLWHRNKFRSWQTGRNAFRAMCTRSPLALIDNKFDGTDRGPVLSPSWGDLRNVLIAGLWLRDISRVDNGNELLLTEGDTGFTIEDLDVYHVRASGCAGEINLYDAAVNRATFRDGLLLDGAGVHGYHGNPANVVFSDYELHGGTFRFESGRVRVENSAVIGSVPSRRNQQHFADKWYSPKPPAFEASPAARVDWVNCRAVTDDPWAESFSGGNRVRAGGYQPEGDE